jgi:hypothetical protein
MTRGSRSTDEEQAGSCGEAGGGEAVAAGAQSRLSETDPRRLVAK